MTRFLYWAMIRACCKHGPGHRRGDCGYAHLLSEVDMPGAGMNPKMWVDRSHVRKGPAGIDWFFGQEYAPLQMERIVSLLMNEREDVWPMWARRVAWFYRLRPVDLFVSDGDFGLIDEFRRVSPEVLRIDSSSEDFLRVEESAFPFVLALDSDGLTLSDRMRDRLGFLGCVQYRKYVATRDWEDDGLYFTTTEMLWGKQSRQFLRVHVGCVYLLICSSDEPEWWYMVSETDVTDVLSLGGWAPPAKFAFSDEYVTLHEVSLPTRVKQMAVYIGDEAPPSALVLHLGSVRVYTDGSTNHGHGIAGGWVYSAGYCSGRASLACKCTGSAASELLGIVGGLYEVFWRYREFRTFIFMVDSLVAMNYVFSGADPVDKEGRDLWPGISLARLLLHRLRDGGITVSAQKVPRAENRAHHIAKTEQRYRYTFNWRVEDDEWPFPIVFKCVFFRIAGNRQLGSDHECVYALPSGVGDALPSIFW